MALFHQFYGYAIERFMYWHYQLWLPLNSQRVQLRSELLKQRSSLPVDHPIVHKWPSGRFTGLLKDVDDVINGVWQSMLNMIDDLMTMLYLIILFCANLAVSVGKQSDVAYGMYVSIFLALGISTMTMPFVWFYLFDSSVQECERMVREGQALYMSTSQETLAAEETLCLTGGEENNDAERITKSDAADAVKSYWIYGRTTFRAFFHRLAWETNY
jgi:ABC-type multidrug transport system fused ATPase/permease subunit